MARTVADYTQAEREAGRLRCSTCDARPSVFPDPDNRDGRLIRCREHPDDPLTRKGRTVKRDEERINETRYRQMNDVPAPAVSAHPAPATGMQVSTLAELKERMATMEYAVSKMKEGVDYGVIPGTSNKSLLLPGGELLRMAFNVPIQFEEIERVVDLESSYVFYRVRGFCIDRDGNIHYQTMRSCSSMEPRWKGWRGTERRHELVDLVPERAQKRAFLDVVRHMTGADRYFKGAAVDATEVVDTETGEISTSQAGYPRDKCPLHGTKWFENRNGGWGHVVSGSKPSGYCMPHQAWGESFREKGEAAGMTPAQVSQWVKAKFSGNTWSKLSPDEIVDAIEMMDAEIAAAADSEREADDADLRAEQDAANEAASGANAEETDTSSGRSEAAATPPEPPTDDGQQARLGE